MQCQRLLLDMLGHGVGGRTLSGPLAGCCRRLWSAGLPGRRAASSAPALVIDGAEYQPDDWTNVTPRLLEHVGRRLHEQPQHPLCLIKQRVTRYMHTAFRNARGNPLFSLHERLGPVVSVAANFDSLLVPADHPSRRRSDNYYVRRDTVLRAHTSAHQTELLAAGLDAFLVAGDVYRRDEIDRTHYPVFHQMEGVRVMNREQVRNAAGRTFLRGNFLTGPVLRSLTLTVLQCHVHMYLMTICMFCILLSVNRPSLVLS